MRRVPAGLALALALPLGTGAARSEMLVAAVSAPVIEISSNFTGTRLAVFGAVERDAATVSRGAEGYDAVVIVSGPPRDFVVRRKARLLGLWANRESRLFDDLPSFYALAASRPLAEIAIPATLKRHQIGLADLVFPEGPESAPEAGGSSEFRGAFVRIQQKAGLYAERVGGVEFLSPHLFRTFVPIPANVPVGRYRVDVFLFHGSALLASKTTELSVVKTGFEQTTHDLATNRGWLYGGITVMLALLTGWLAGVIFRRD